MNVENNDLNMQVFENNINLLELESKNSKMINFDKLKDIDANQAITDLETTKGFFKKMGVKKKYLKLFNTFKQNEFKPNKKELIDYYKIAEKDINYKKFIAENEKELDRLLGIKLIDNYKDGINLKEKYENTYNFMNNLKVLGDYTNRINATKYFLDLASLKTPSTKMVFNLLNDKFKNYKVKEEALNAKYDIDYKIIEQDTLDLDVFESLLKYSSNADNFTDLLNIAQINKLGAKLNELGLGALIDALKANKFSYVDLVDEFTSTLHNLKEKLRSIRI